MRARTCPINERTWRLHGAMRTPGKFGARKWARTRQATRMRHDGDAETPAQELFPSKLRMAHPAAPGALGRQDLGRRRGERGQRRTEDLG